MVSVLPLPLLICGRGTGIESVRRKRFINFVTGLALALAPALTFTAISLFNATMSNKLRGWWHDHSRVTLCSLALHIDNNPGAGSAQAGSRCILTIDDDDDDHIDNNPGAKD